MDHLLHDLKYAAQLLVKHKGFTLTAVLTLGLVIGAQATITSVVDSVLLRPLPFPEAERIAFVYNSYPKAGVERAATSVPHYFDRREAIDAFSEQALFRDRQRSIELHGTPERIRAMQVTPSFFRLLQAEPHLGRTFSDQEGEVGHEKRVVLSHGLWQELYGGEENILGRELRIDGELHEVVGVLPASFHFLDPEVRMWTPAAFSEEQRSDGRRHSNNYGMIARLAPGATLALAQEQIDSLNATNLERFPQYRELLINAGFNTRVVALAEDLVRDVRQTLYLLWGGVFFVLLIGCVNIANLTLVRSSSRLKELATRLAIGAGRRRIAKQLLTESLLLALLGGLLGLALGRGGLELLRPLGLELLPRGTEVAMNASAIAATLGLALLVGLLIGVIPILHVLRSDLNGVLREEGRGGTGGRGQSVLRRILVTAQVAIAFVLLMSSGLLLASFREVLTVDPGFTEEGLLTASVSLPASRYADADSRRAFGQRFLEEMRALPGVEEAGLTSSLPFGGNYSDSVILARGYEMAPGESLISPSQLSVSAGYFEAMGMALQRGRLFDERDHADSAPVIIVDERLARRFWPEEDPIGQEMFFPNNAEDLTRIDDDTVMIRVVGVVGTIRDRALVEGEERVGAYYLPLEQFPDNRLGLALRTSADPVGLSDSVRRALLTLDPEMPLYDIRTMADRIDQSLVERRSPMVLALVFGGLALFLAALGLYGVLAFLVAQRRKEIGIRMALGAHGRRVMRLVLDEGLMILAGGLTLGVLGTFALRGTLASQLYGVGSLDPRVLGGALLVLAAVALAAALGPAFRAVRVDPVRALQE